MEMLLFRDVNSRLGHPFYGHKDDLVTTIASNGLEDQIHHFILRLYYRGAKGWTSRIWRGERPVTVRRGVGTALVQTVGTSTTSLL